MKKDIIWRGDKNRNRIIMGEVVCDTYEWKDAQYTHLEELWLSGLPSKEIAKDLDVTESELEAKVRKARELGYDIPRRNNVAERKKTGKVFK